MALFGRDKIDELRQRADIVELIGAHVRLRRTGRNYTGLCPFHSEKTPSFSVNPERGFFHCFGCGAGGTVFDFVMRTDGVTFPEAVRLLARRYGVTLPERVDEGPGAGERDAMLQAAQVASEFFAHVLWKTPNGAPAREYLKRRAIGAEIAQECLLGFAPMQTAALAKALERRNLLDAGIRIGLVKQSGGVHDMFRGRLMFPIRDGQGRALAFGGRVLDDRLPKYINSTESPLYSKARNLYGIYEARRAIARNDRAIVVEGYIDAIALWQAGFRETVASLGTAVTVDQLRLLGRHTRNVLACFDGDSAGQKASIRALPVFLEAGLLGRGIFLPAGLDPDRLIRERGVEAFKALIDSSELLVDYFLASEARPARGSLSGQARAAERVAEMLRLVANPFEFDLLSRKAAGMLGVSEQLLRNHARPPGKGAGARRPVQPGAPPKDTGAATEAAVGLLAVALAYPELRSEIIEGRAPAEFEDRGLADLLAEVCHSTEEGPSFETAVAERLSDEQRSRLSALLVGSLMDEMTEARKLSIGYIAALERRRHRREVEGMARSAAQPDEGQATAAAQAVISLRRGANQQR